MRSTIIVSLLFLAATESLLAQRFAPPTTNDHRRFALSIGAGSTQGYDLYEVIGPDHPDMQYVAPQGLNFTLGFTWYHKNRWFTSLHWHQFDSWSGMSASIMDPITRSTRGRQRATSSIFNDYSIRAGRTFFFNNSRWQTRWLLGANVKNVSFDYGDRPTQPVDDTYLNIRRTRTPDIDRGLAPSLQAGYQVAFRGGRMGLSFMILGNLGLKYYSSDEYEVWINNESYTTTISTKNDLIAFIFQYEVYFGNTSSRRDVNSD